MEPFLLNYSGNKAWWDVKLHSNVMIFQPKISRSKTTVYTLYLFPLQRMLHFDCAFLRAWIVWPPFLYWHLWCTKGGMHHRSWTLSMIFALSKLGLEAISEREVKQGRQATSHQVIWKKPTFDPTILLPLSGKVCTKNWASDFPKKVSLSHFGVEHQYISTCWIGQRSRCQRN